MLEILSAVSEEVTHYCLITCICSSLFHGNSQKQCRQALQVISGPKSYTVMFCNLSPQFPSGLHSCCKPMKSY